MIKRLTIVYVFISLLHYGSFGQVKILFDCTKAETSGNADWVIDADLHNIDWESNDAIGTGTASNPQRYPTPAQSTITTGSAETTWEGALSAWGIDCVNYGYEVETLTPHDSITYGNVNHAQDLMNYKVYVMDEPNIRFTQSEKNAILNFVKNGGGLFMISDHNNSDRNNDGWDSPNIWNDFMNTVTPINPFGIKFDLDYFSPASTNVSVNTHDSLTNGPYGAVSLLTFSGATIMHIYPDSNSTATGDIWMDGVSQSSHDSIMFAHAHFGAGKVAAISDSSPEDDGTGNPACQLYAQYLTGDNGSDRKLFMNAIIWLAEEPAVVSDSLHLVTAADTTICSGGSVTMTAAGATTYLWQPGGATSASITVQPSANGLYIVTGTTSGVSKQDTVHVTVDAFSGTTPQITVNGPLTFCSSGSLTLTAPAESGYAWSNSSSLQSITVSQTGAYVATLTDANGCHTTTNTVNVTADAFSLTNPQISASGPLSFCSGSNVVLSAPAGYTYVWNNSSTQQTITVTQSGSFYATVTDANNCHAQSDTAAVNVSSGNLSGVQITPAGPQTVCSGGSINLSAPSGYGAYLWSNGATQQSISVSQPGNYYATVTISGNCHGSSDTVSVSIDNFSTSTPQISANGPLTFCQGGSVTLSVSGGASYNWSNSTQQSSVTVTQTGSFQVTVTDANQCSAVSQSTSVTVNAGPQISFAITPDSVCSNTGSVLLNATPAGGTYQGTGLNGLNFEPPVAGQGTYVITYTATNNNGCTSSDSSSITVYICTGIENLSAEDISVYPNPSTGEFMFQTSSTFAPEAIRVYDATGRQVMEMVNVSGSANLLKLNLAGFANGIYIAEFSRNNMVIRKKLVKAE